RASDSTRPGRGDSSPPDAAPTSPRAFAWTRPRSSRSTCRALTRSFRGADNGGVAWTESSREPTHRTHPHAHRRGAAADRLLDLLLARPRADRCGHLHPGVDHRLGRRGGGAAAQSGHDARHAPGPDRRQAARRGRARLAAGDRQDRRLGRRRDRPTRALGDGPPRACGIGAVRRPAVGTIGATNVLGAAGRVAALATLAGDTAKGYGAVWAAAWLAGGALAPKALCAVAAVVGNCWSVFLGFRGGKGVATGLGALLNLMPLAVLPAIPAWLAVVLTTRYVSLGSIV